MRLSFSHISTYLTCPKRYWFRYIEKTPEPLWWSASLGTSVHNALYRFAQEIHGDALWRTLDDAQRPPQQSLFQEPPTLPSLVRLLILLDENWVQAGYPDKERMYAAKETAIALVRHWYARRAPEMLNTVAVELPFTEHIGGVQVAGRFDRIDKQDGELRVIDYKTGSVRTQEQADTDLQLGIYALVLHRRLGLDTVRLALYFLREDLMLETMCTADQCAEVSDTLHQVSSSIRGEDFAATPTTERCSSCPFRTLCPDAL